MNEKILNPGQILTGVLFNEPIRVVVENEQEEGRQVYEVYKENLGYDTPALISVPGNYGSLRSKGFQQIQRLPSTFAIADLERVCPSVSRDMIRVVLNRLRKEGRLLCKGTGRNARWEKRGNDQPKRGNKRGNTG